MPPIWICLAAIVLFIWPIISLRQLLSFVQGEQRLYQRIARDLRAIKSKYSFDLRNGLPLVGYDEIGQCFETIPLAPFWDIFVAQFVKRYDDTGTDRFWSSQSAEIVFNETSVLESRLNRNLYTAIPGIVTGAGLLCTFIAILFALLDVKLANKQFTGLDKLVSGLSGKFLSSIAALLGATIFLFCEKWFLHNLTKSLHELVVALDALVPRLTSAHLLNEIRSYMEEQSTAFKHFNSDLSIKLKQGVEEGMGPTRDRMVGAIEELNQVLRAVEAQKSVTRNLSQIATQTSAMVAAAAGSTKAIQEAGVAIEHVAQLAASQVESFKVITGSMQRYAEIFRNVQDTAGKLLVQIDQHLRGYQETTKDGYEKLTILVNSSLADATSKLGATVNELDEHLQDLTEILGRVHR